LEERLLE
jgi:hypothetical protein